MHNKTHKRHFSKSSPKDNGSLAHNIVQKTDMFSRISFFNGKSFASFLSLIYYNSTFKKNAGSFDQIIYLLVIQS